MSIRLIRQESETPNVTNTDDARMVRYAYGGYNGFVKNRGTEIGYSINGSTFKVTSGVLNLQGWEAEIDANGVDISTSGSVNKRYFSVFYEVNAATDTASVKSSYSETGYPAIDAGDDLTETTNGTARLLLYTFDVQNTVISNVQKKVQAIPFVSDAVDEIQSELSETVTQLENGDIIPAKSNDSKLINSLEIKRDENGVLKIGDTIIPQKKLLWSGDLTIETGETDQTIPLSESLTNGDIIEIVTEEGIYKFTAAINISSFKSFYCHRINGVGTSQINVNTLYFTTSGTSPKSLTVKAPKGVTMYSGSGNNYSASISSGAILGSFYYHPNDISWTVRKIYKVIE